MGSPKYTASGEIRRKKRNRVNGLYAIDIRTSEEYLRFEHSAKSDKIASYFVDLATITIKEGMKSLVVILDGNPTHKGKMQQLCKTILKEKGIQLKLKFWPLPSYSPDFNLVEYAIQLFRKKYLHHIPFDLGIDNLIEILSNTVKENKTLSPEKNS